MFKPSKFNFFYNRSNNENIVYNTFSKALISLDDEHMESLKNNALGTMFSDEEIGFLFDNGFLVEKTTDENEFLSRKQNTGSSYKGMIDMPILNVCNLCKTYLSGEAEVKALDHVSFTVEKGEFISIIGPSGSGKSTLLHILAGIDRPTSGKVTVDGEDIYAKNEKELAYYRRRKAGLIYQFYNLVPTLTVEENITLPYRLDKKKADKETLNRLLDTLGMTERRTHLPSQLSGGQQQRCAIGRVLFTNPALMLADEPTGNLDSKSASEVMELLKSANKQYGQTLIMITHNLELAEQADRMLIIKDGKLSEGKV